MSEYRLHCFAQSGNSYKVALMLALTGADWEPVWVDFFHGGTRTPEYLELNEMGEVPVLEHGELRLSQSGVILDYLAQRFRDFAPKSEEERREVLRWTLWDNHKLTGSIAPLRFLMKFVPEEKTDQRVIAWLGKRAGNALKVLDRHLFTQEWVAADRIDHRRPLLRRLSLLRPRVRPRPHRLPEHRALAPGDRRPPRLEAPLRPDAGPPDPAPGRLT